jgi:ABC-type multidrug transport system ATPase subunit/ABC-type transporter Mla maintaining outer membrane lipid asymmetry permease subunit MlaE
VSGAPAAISLRGFGLTIRNEGREEILLQGCDLEVPAGGFYLLCGRSGSGKSTLLHLITGLLDPREARPRTSGELRVLGTRTCGQPAPGAAHRSRVSAVLQDEGLLDDLSPRQNVELALEAAGRSTKLAVGLLSLAGLSDPPIDVAALSGGMRKRTAVARALAAEPDLFLFDEPTAGLDPKAARDIALLLRETHGREGKRTTIVISHDVEAFAGMLDGVLVLDAEDRSLRLQSPDEEIPEQEAPVRWTKPAPFEDPAVSGARRLLLEVGALAESFVEACLRLPPSFPRLALGSVLHTTVESVLFVSMAAFLAGALAVYFTLENSPLSGAFVDELLTGAGKVLVVVVIPLVAGFFFTARMAAGAAARLGNMKRHNSVAALQLMGVRPSEYLLTPLVWAFSVALPIVSLAAIAFASLSAALMAWVVEAVSARRFCSNYFLEVSAQDLRVVLLKAAVSGFLVAVFTYHLAMSPKRSGRDVGSAVNLSIVIGMLTVLVVHGMATIWQFG